MARAGVGVVAGVAIAAAVAAVIPAAAGAQYSDDPWACAGKPNALRGFARSRNHPETAFGGSYSVHYNVSAMRCGTLTEIRYYLWASTQNLPGGAYILLQYSSYGNGLRRRAACVKSRADGRTRCYLQVKSGKTVPAPTSAPIYQFRRTRRRPTKVNLFYGAAREGAGTEVGQIFPHNIRLKLRWYRL